MACVGVPDGTVNEDVGLTVSGLVAVIDGVTQPPGLDSGCVHGVAWYGRRLAAALACVHGLQPEDSLPDVLAMALERVCAEHSQCDLGHPGTPAAAVGMLRAGCDRVDYLVLCDTTLVLDHASTEVVTDDRLQTTIAKLIAQERAWPADPAERQRGHARAKWPYRNQDGGYWIAAAQPFAAHEAVVGSVTGLRRAALLTDGARRAVDIGLTDWPSLLNTLDGRGPLHLINELRKVERRAPKGEGKLHDDATAAYCVFPMEVITP